MTTASKEEARKRTEMLSALRKQRSERVKQAQATLKEQQAFRKALQRAMQAGPRSVPQLAEAIGAPADAVLWHVTSMKKYGLVEEVGMDEDQPYYLYGLSKAAQS